MDDEVMETLEKMKRQVDQSSLRRAKVTENRQEKKHKKDKQILQCMAKLQRLNAELSLLEQEQDSILEGMRKQLNGKSIPSPTKSIKQIK